MTSSSGGCASSTTSAVMSLVIDAMGVTSVGFCAKSTSPVLPSTTSADSDLSPGLLPAVTVQDRATATTLARKILPFDMGRDVTANRASGLLGDAVHARCDARGEVAPFAPFASLAAIGRPTVSAFLKS